VQRPAPGRELPAAPPTSGGRTDFKPQPGRICSCCLVSLSRQNRPAPLPQRATIPLGRHPLPDRLRVHQPPLQARGRCSSSCPATHPSPTAGCSAGSPHRQHGRSYRFRLPTLTAVPSTVRRSLTPPPPKIAVRTARATFAIFAIIGNLRPPCVQMPRRRLSRPLASPQPEDCAGRRAGLPRPGAVCYAWLSLPPVPSPRCPCLPLPAGTPFPSRPQRPRPARAGSRPR
jgi:hypothetical protein